jgi:hypothetical protein
MEGEAVGHKDIPELAVPIRMSSITLSLLLF